MTVAHSASDIKTTPLFMWSVVCSAKELQLIFPKDYEGKTLMNYYNFYMRKYRGGDNLAIEKLSVVNREVNSLPEGVKRVVFTRLGRYNRIRKENPSLFKKSEKGVLSQWTYPEWITHNYTHNSLGLCLEETLCAICTGIFTTVDESIQLTASLNPSVPQNGKYLYQRSILDSIITKRFLEESFSHTEKPFVMAFVQLIQGKIPGISQKEIDLLNLRFHLLSGAPSIAKPNR
jgi:hypothetical protein